LSDKKIMSGNQSAALAVKLSRAQVVSAYPITPQTSLIETLAHDWASGAFKGQFVVVDSEYSALSYLVGAGYAGARVFTATGSHGLVYMHELLHWAAGARLPVVMVNVNRALGAPWCLEPDHLDSLSQRDTGWIQLYCASVQEILDTVVMAFRLAWEVKVPCMVVYDGFSLSHTYEMVEVPGQEAVDRFLPPLPDHPTLAPSRVVNIQPLVGSKKMHELIRDRCRGMEKVPLALDAMAEDFRILTGRNYRNLEPENLEGSSTVIICAGSISQTVEHVLPTLNALKGEGVGMIRLRLFRPFPAKQLLSLLEGRKIKHLVVIDRCVSAGSGGIMAQEIRSVLQGADFRGSVVELNLAGGLDLTPEMVAKGLEQLSFEKKADAKTLTWGSEL